MNKTLSDEIRLCKAWAANNPYQGNDKKVLFVCSMGILRSATAARIYSSKYNTRSAGTYDEALIPLTVMLVEWAEEIVFVNKANYDAACHKFKKLEEIHSKVMRGIVLNIPDAYPHMAPEIIDALKEQYDSKL